MPSYETFIDLYPAFAAASEALVQAHLDAAAADTSETIWGDQYAAGVMLKAADSLAQTPEGRRMRLSNDDNVSIYHKRLLRMRRLVAVGAHRVVGH